ncbi:hypothetical protein [Novacetimonas cocois]|nr:hypothetical protein [Novacetimonas cocois]
MDGDVRRLFEMVAGHLENSIEMIEHVYSPTSYVRRRWSCQEPESFLCQLAQEMIPGKTKIYKEIMVLLDRIELSTSPLPNRRNAHNILIFLFKK